MKLVLLLVLITVTGGDGRRAVAGQAGGSVTLSCKYDVKTHHLLSFCWNRGNVPQSGCDKQLIKADQLTVREGTRASSRYQLLGRLDEGDVSLTVLNLTQTDAGLYGCRIEIPGLFNDEKQHFLLTIHSAPQTTTSTPVNTETSTQQTTAAYTPGHLTTTGRVPTPSSSSSSSSISASSSGVVAVACVAFCLTVLLMSGGVVVVVVVVVVARKWRRLNKASRQQLVNTSVQLSSSLPTLQLQNPGSLAENIYQIDGGEYEFCP